MYRLIIGLLCFFLSGCWINRIDDSYYKKQMLDGKLIEYKLEEKSKLISMTSEKGVLKVDHCIYGLFLGSLPPLNFWDIRFTDEALINLAIKKLQKKDPNIKGLSRIKIDPAVFILPIVPIFGWGCEEITGFPIYASTD